MINMDLEKEDLINLICGYKPNLQQCLQLEKSGFMKFSGNQHNEDWEWKRSFLNGLDELLLLRLYYVVTKTPKDEPMELRVKI